MRVILTKQEGLQFSKLRTANEEASTTSEQLFNARGLEGLTDPRLKAALDKRDEIARTVTDPIIVELAMVTVQHEIQVTI